jgi:hypothetical protein
MTNTDRRVTEIRGDAPTRRTWEPMSLTRIGAFEDVLRGGTGKGTDAFGKKP